MRLIKLVLQQTQIGNNIKLTVLFWDGTMGHVYV